MFYEYTLQLFQTLFGDYALTETGSQLVETISVLFVCLFVCLVIKVAFAFFKLLIRRCSA